jgi:ACT domain-containing protein
VETKALKRIVTDKELEANAKEGVFRVTKDMILTPFARDFAMQNGIRLEYSSDASTSAQSNHGTPEDQLSAAIREIVEAELGHNEVALEAAIAQEVRAQLTDAPPENQDSVSSAVSAVLTEKHRVEGSTAQAVITIAGENHAGIVAKVSEAIGEMGANIVDISQTVVGDYFTMILVVDITDLEESGTGFSVFREAVQVAAKQVGVAANVMHENILRTMHRVV